MHIEEDQQVELRVRLCEGSSRLARASAIVALTALVLHVICVSNSYWMEGKIRDDTVIAHSGLWQDCSLTNLFTPAEFRICASYQVSHHLDTIPRFLKVCQAFAILGILGHVTSCVLLLVFSLLPKLTNKKVVLFACIIANAVSGFFVLVALSVYPAEYPDRQLPPFTVSWKVSWCFGLDLLSVMASVLVVGVLLWDYRMRVSHFAISGNSA